MNERYDLLKVELIDIAKVVNEFPEQLQMPAYQLLVEQLLSSEDNSIPPAESPWQDIIVPPDETSESDGWDYAEELRKFFNMASTQRPYSSFSNVEAITLLAYFRTEYVPVEKRVQGVSGEDFMEMCEIIGRPKPKMLRSPINNAKYQGYLRRSGHGIYILDDIGRKFVGEVLGR